MEDKQEQIRVTPEVVTGCWEQAYREDKSFRAEFDKDPRKAVTAILGVEIPSDMKIVVHRSSPRELHVVLPEAELADADAQLEGVYGGHGWNAADYPYSSGRYAGYHWSKIPAERLPVWHHGRNDG